MKEEIFKDIDRLSLHDSSLNKIERSQDSLILIMDWAKLEDYIEPKNLKWFFILYEFSLAFVTLKK